VPSFDLPDDFRQFNSMLIESMAEQTRDTWRLSRGPIPDVIRTLEAHGVLIALSSMGSEHLDAFSEYNADGRALICLGIDKEIMVRRRFDAAHELGHLILHRKVDRKTLNRAADFRTIEMQANLFANAFLLPAKSFADELFTPSLDGFRALKGRWKVSIAAMIHRSQSLNLVTDEQAKRLWINLNRRDWRKFEPLDDIAPERPLMIAKCFSTLVTEGIKSKDQIVMDLRLAARDIEELGALPNGYLSGDADAAVGPQLKRQQTGNVISFRR
jgi:Zn-dependent peptidase ImmA (M78 family)